MRYFQEDQKIYSIYNIFKDNTKYLLLSNISYYLLMKTLTLLYIGFYNNGE